MTPAEREAHERVLLTPDGRGKVAKRAALDALLADAAREQPLTLTIMGVDPRNASVIEQMRYQLKRADDLSGGNS